MPGSKTSPNCQLAKGQSGRRNLVTWNFEIIDIATATNELALHRGSGRIASLQFEAKQVCFVSAKQKLILGIHGDSIQLLIGTKE
jgi:hypothetical protein